MGCYVWPGLLHTEWSLWAESWPAQVTVAVAHLRLLKSSRVTGRIGPWDPLLSSTWLQIQRKSASCDAGAGLLAFPHASCPVILPTHSRRRQCVKQVSKNPKGKTPRPGRFIFLAVTSLHDVYHLPCPSLMLLLETSVSDTLVKTQPCWVHADPTLRPGTCDLPLERELGSKQR